MSRSITQQKGRGSLRHNNREFISKNVDKSRIKNNVILKHESLKNAYDRCFGDALKDYNDSQKRKDRRISDYFEHLFGVSADSAAANNVLQSKDKTKSFYEDIVQIGDINDTGVINNPAAAERAKQALIEYADGFSKRNPQFYVFNSVIHMDEVTPHLHIDYIPFAIGYERGMSIQNGYDKALKQMGYKNNAHGASYQTWRENERNVLHDICKRYGLNPKPREMEQGRGYTYTPEEYRKMMKEAEDAKNEADKILKDAKTLQDNVMQGLSIARKKNKQLNDREETLKTKENELAEREKALQLKEMKIELEVRKRVSERIALQNEAENAYNSRELPFDDIDYRNPRN